MKSVNQVVIKDPDNEGFIAIPTERRQGLNTLTALQAQPTTATVPPVVHRQTEESASIPSADRRTQPAFPTTQMVQLRAVRKSAAHTKLGDILGKKPIGSVKLYQHIPPEKIVHLEQKKANLDKIVQKMQRKKTNSENHYRSAKTKNNLASAESVPAYGSQASADRIYAPAVVPTPKDAAGKGRTGNSFPIPVDFFTAYQIARPTTRAICATADISTAAYQQDSGAANQDGMPTHQQRHAAVAAADEKRKASALLLSRMPHLSRRPKTAETAVNLHSPQVQLHLPCTALHARMPNLSRATERGCTGTANKLSRLRAARYSHQQCYCTAIWRRATHGRHNCSLTHMVGRRSRGAAAGTRT